MDISHLIAARPTQRRHLATWYSELLDAAEHEGLSVAELADRLGVVKETIYARGEARAILGVEQAVLLAALDGPHDSSWALGRATGLGL